MNEVKKFLGALRNLKEDFGMNGGGFIEYATRMGALIELADEERRPVADKALSLWLSSGTPHCEGWLREQSAEVILQAAGPAKQGPQANVYIGPFPVCGAASAIEMDIFFPSGICSVEPERDSTCADRAQKAWDKYGDEARQEWLREQSADFIATSSEQEFDACLAWAAVVKAVRKVFGPREWVRPGPAISEAVYPLREECADAAQWLVMKGVRMGSGGNLGAGEWLRLRDIHKPQWIIDSARLRLEELNAKRQPVADAALILWTVFGARVGSLCETCPVDLLSKFENERAFHADKARDVYFKRVGVPSYIQGQMMVMGWDWIESEWLSLQGPKRRGTRIAVKRLGTAAVGAEVLVSFYKGGELVSSHLISGKVSESKYCRHVWVCDYDEYRVIGDACVSVEAVYESR